MQNRATLLWGTAMGGLAVAIGAFGAHAFKPILIELGKLETFELAVRYQFYHALAMLATGIISNRIESRFVNYSGLCFLFGILFFSGSLYVLCFSGLGVLGAITPIGGILFIFGWLFLFFGIYKKQKPQ